jgi:hypothetical protein
MIVVRVPPKKRTSRPCVFCSFVPTHQSPRVRRWRMRWQLIRTVHSISCYLPAYQPLHTLILTRIYPLPSGVMLAGDLELLARSLSSPTKRICAHTPRLTELGYLINRAGLITQTLLSWRTDWISEVGFSFLVHVDHPGVFGVGFSGLAWPGRVHPSISLCDALHTTSLYHNSQAPSQPYHHITPWYTARIHIADTTGTICLAG